MMAYFRPIIFNFFAPRDGYDPLKQASIDDPNKLVTGDTLYHHGKLKKSSIYAFNLLTS